MHSRVLVRDLNSGIESSYTPVFPQDADIAQGKISILAPIATALLGYREGDEIEWPTPGGRRRLKIIKVLYQPEAAGDEPEHSVALYRQSRELDELTNPQEKGAYGRELPGEALMSTSAEGEMT